MSFLDDAKAQWAKLPPAGKIAIGGGAVVLLVIMAFKHQAGGGTTTSASGLMSGGLPPTNDSSTQAPAGAFPGVSSGGNNVPFLPSGVNPVYDNQGGLVAFQQGAAGNPSTSGPTSPPPGPTQSGGSTSVSQSGSSGTSKGFNGLLGANLQGVNTANRTYEVNGKWIPIPIPAGSKIVQGSQGRIWYTDSGGQHLLTSGQGPAIDPTTNKPATGGGGESLPSYARAITEYHVQYGDNLNAVATQLRIPGGLPAWIAFNNYPTRFYHGMKLRIPNYDQLVSVPH